MSFLDNIGRAVGKLAGFEDGKFRIETALDPFGIGRKFGHDVLHIPTAEESRNQQAAIQGQIDLTKKQSRLADEATARAKESEAVEKRRINEKQIRGLRRQFRPAGFLDDGPGLSDKLGD